MDAYTNERTHFFRWMHTQTKEHTSSDGCIYKQNNTLLQMDAYTNKITHYFRWMHTHTE